ncbi:TetR/AcrR family transcriptional regulator [Streptomyces hoynatensis]|uniref:TetR/AcrR family transcriptional regulator n=1 Tax=Streptomyces hoynatensis TaxID=1141874 RepID=A0A3A9YMS4_9ACTN|nr:TetR/AcrR family transcriptional regulator [Streptomyces hoynatensis]RKN37389.1 TetR/AcrR family transcriptional regulator [Streptomyces hoynatensis]
MPPGEASEKWDPAHLMDLLWRTRPRGTRGPRGSLSLDEVVAAGVEIADEEGLAGVSMRKVAGRLGVTVMSLYRYVPSKEDLLDLMFEMATPEPTMAADWPTDWRGRLTAYAHEMRKLLVERSWMLDIPISTPPMGPHNFAWMDLALGAMADTPLTEDDKLGILILISGYAMNESRQIVSMNRAVARTGVSYEEWGEVYHRMLERATATGRFPALTRVVESEVFARSHATAEEDFDYGLSFLLDGVAALIAQREKG